MLFLLADVTQNTQKPVKASFAELDESILASSASLRKRKKQ